MPPPATRLQKDRDPVTGRTRPPTGPLEGRTPSQAARVRRRGPPLQAQAARCRRPRRDFKKIGTPSQAARVRRRGPLKVGSPRRDFKKTGTSPQAVRVRRRGPSLFIHCHRDHSWPLPAAPQEGPAMRSALLQNSGLHGAPSFTHPNSHPLMADGGSTACKCPILGQMQPWRQVGWHCLVNSTFLPSLSLAVEGDGT